LEIQIADDTGRGTRRVRIRERVASWQAGVAAALRVEKFRAIGNVRMKAQFVAEPDLRSDRRILDVPDHAAATPRQRRRRNCSRSWSWSRDGWRWWWRHLLHLKRAREIVAGATSGDRFCNELHTVACRCIRTGILRTCDGRDRAEEQSQRQLS